MERGGVTTAADAVSVDEFRSRARRWLADHAAELVDPPTEERPFSRRALTVLYDAGFGGVTAPVEYGGLGLSQAHQDALSAELRAYPDVVAGDLVTLGICVPTLLDFGTEVQLRRHVPRMLRGDEGWTQLLSEPGAGSDLAGLQTRVVRDGDEWVANGQKVWTSAAQWCEYGLMIGRTDPDVPKHRGLSMFIVDLAAPGVTIRPLRQMTGATEFNEVFLDDVRLPADALVGGENEGWAALLRMLMHERMAIGTGTSGARLGRDMFEVLLDRARADGVDADPAIRRALLDLYVRERILSLMGERMRQALARGQEPGPEGSVAKIANAALSRAAADAGMLVGGPASLAWDPADPRGPDLALACLFSPMTAIAGGTTEIQRNTIGERVLGLPKEPQVDRDVPFRDVLQNPTARAGTGGA